MADDTGDGSERRRFPRTPLSMLVQYRFNSFEDFLAEYSLNISPGGMFIRTDKPLEEGAMVYLQFSLKDGSRLIEGMGKVFREKSAGVKDQPAGISREFADFVDESMSLMQEI